MRKTRFGLVLVVALFAGVEAHAQFANKRLGFELGGFSFNDAEISAGLAVQLEGNYYIENGFDVGIRIPAILLLTKASNKQEFGTGGQLYVRYLFSEESLRPYVGLAIDVLVVLRGQVMGDMTSTNQMVFFGPQPFGGIDFFVVDTVSIGARAFFTAHIAINNRNVFRPTFGGYANVHFYF